MGLRAGGDPSNEGFAIERAATNRQRRQPSDTYATLCPGRACPPGGRLSPRQPDIAARPDPLSRTRPAGLPPRER